MTSAAPRLVEVALPLPLFQTFTYEVPENLENPVANGSRVVVPFRNRRRIGICVGESGSAEARGRVREVVESPDATPAVSESVLVLCKWIAEYYVVPLGVALRAALPALLTGAADPAPARKTQRIARLRQEIPSLLERERIFARAPRQRAIFEMLESMGGRVTVAHLVEKLKFTPSILRSLVDRGLVEIVPEEIDRDPFATRALIRDPHHPPTPAQSEAIERILSGAPGSVFLLHGITGSGKTLVYIEVLKRILADGARSAIVLVPEIALTPQTVDRFRSVFGDSIAVMHSALSDGERYDAWLALKRGEKRIAVGARSAIFAPLQDIGAIIVDEEHEASYKQGENPRYHAREVAIVRGKREGSVVVLGTATPSLESWTNAIAGKFELVELPARVGGGRLPVVEVTDLRSPRAARASDGSIGGSYESVVRQPLDRAISECLGRGDQAILLLNRRGYSSFVQCQECGFVSTCPDCSISLTHHRSPERLVCHYCMHEEQVPVKCPRCMAPTLRQRGLGTQQVERLVGERFPHARIARMDVDTTSGKWAHAEILDRVGAGEVDILLGTQMIAKGLDFPDVTLVGVIDADTGINLPDFRASERCFQLLSQVAGRAGRGVKGGQVVIQTRVPEHHAVRCAVAHDYASFVREELEGRIDPPYPPNLRLVNIVFSGTRERDTMGLAIEGGDWIRKLVRERASDEVTVVGAAPCPVERIKTRWRWHVLLKSESAGELTRICRYFMEKFDVPAVAGLRVTLDRDPVALL